MDKSTRSEYHENEDFSFFQCEMDKLLVQKWNRIILVGCAQTAAVLDESMIGGMGDCWDSIIG